MSRTFQISAPVGLRSVTVIAGVKVYLTMLYELQASFAVEGYDKVKPVFNRAQHTTPRRRMAEWRCRFGHSCPRQWQRTGKETACGVHEPPRQSPGRAQKATGRGVRPSEGADIWFQPLLNTRNAADSGGLLENGTHLAGVPHKACDRPSDVTKNVLGEEMLINSVRGRKARPKNGGVLQTKDLLGRK